MATTARANAVVMTAAVTVGVTIATTTNVGTTGTTTGAVAIGAALLYSTPVAPSRPLYFTTALGVAMAERSRHHHAAIA
jgi:hypothetical protein